MEHHKAVDTAQPVEADTVQLEMVGIGHLAEAFHKEADTVQLAVVPHKVADIAPVAEELRSEALQMD
jgi:hypothetical protein